MTIRTRRRTLAAVRAAAASRLTSRALVPVLVVVLWVLGLLLVSAVLAGAGRARAAEPDAVTTAPVGAAPLASVVEAKPTTAGGGPLRVELNSATLEQLQQLPGIGPKKAEAIVALRARRPFTRVTQLLEVRGIGRRTLERLRPFVIVEDTAPVHASVVSPAARASRRAGREPDPDAPARPMAVGTTVPTAAASGAGSGSGG